MAYQSGKSILWSMVLVLSLSLAGCGGRAYHKQMVDGVEKVYYKDETGQKRVVYQVEKDGSVTVYDENDPMYKNFAAGQKWGKVADQYVAELERKKEERAKKAEQERLERIQHIRDAKKRRPYDPIFVSVHEPQMESKDPQAARKTTARVHQFVCGQIDSDKVLRIASGRPDVEVFSKIYFKQGLGFDKKTRRPVSVAVFYFEFNVRSNYLPEDNYTFEEHGHWMQNQQIVQRASDRIRKVIKNMIGPNIPAERDKYL